MAYFYLSVPNYLVLKKTTQQQQKRQKETKTRKKKNKPTLKSKEQDLRCRGEKQAGHRRAGEEV